MVVSGRLAVEVRVRLPVQTEDAVDGRDLTEQGAIPMPQVVRQYFDPF